MNKESLSHLPALVQDMDENLVINIEDFVNNPLLKNQRLHKHKLIDVIKTSNKFHYDTKTAVIKWKEKADRNILIIGNFLKTEEENETFLKEAYIRKVVKEISKNYANKIKKIDHIGMGFHVVFEHEDISMEVEKYFLDITTNNSSELYEYNNEENKLYFEDLKNSNICLAAESLKRRIGAMTKPKYINNIQLQLTYINGLVLNPTVLAPRRFTVMENSINRTTRKSISPNNKFHIISHTLSHSNTMNNQHKRNSGGYTQNMQIMPQESIPYIPANKRSSFVHNKFDLQNANAPLIKAGHDYNHNSMFMEDDHIVGRQKSGTMAKQKKGRKSITTTNALNFGRKDSYIIPFARENISNNLKEIIENQNKAAPGDGRKSSYFRPEGINSLNMFQNNFGIIPESHVWNNQNNLSKLFIFYVDLDVEFSYNPKEILSVYFHMNYLKKFEKPDKFSGNSFNSAFMLEEQKNGLESIKKAAPVNNNIAFRNRSNTTTFVGFNTRRGNSVSYLIFSFISFLNKKSKKFPSKTKLIR